MKKRIYNQASLFGPLYAYLVVISPPENIKNDVAGIKKQLNAIADIKERNLHSIAHITLTDKLTDDVDFPDSIRKLVSGNKPFSVKVNGWDFFNHGNSITVYLKISASAPILNLMASVKSQAKSPHISLAKKISHETFNKLKPYLENLDYSAEWTCNKITVLRKLMPEKHLGFKESFKIPLEENNR